MALQFGAHVGGSHNPIEEAAARGAQVVQIFLSDPKTFDKPATQYPGGAEALKQAAEDAGIGIYVHAPYVINVATTNNRVRIPSRKLLQQTVAEAAAIGARGVIVHGGHVTAQDDPASGFVNWRKAIDSFTPECPVLIENTAGGNFAMTRYLEEIAAVWTAFEGSENLGQIGFCLDTCHAWAAGLDLATVVDDIRAITGRIDLVHLNDSRDEAGSGQDRHDNLGHGHIPEELLVGVVAAADTASVLETKGDAAQHRTDLDWIRARV